MEKLTYNPKTHLFICCRSRDNGKACCSSKGADEMVDEIKSWIKNEQLFRDIKVSRTSCLGYCETGIAACIYPQNQWLHEISLQDLPKIKKMLLTHVK